MQVHCRLLEVPTKNHNSFLGTSTHQLPGRGQKKYLLFPTEAQIVPKDKEVSPNKNDLQSRTREKIAISTAHNEQFRHKVAISRQAEVIWAPVALF